ncbi:sensor histidine kinase [Cohnella suwonensis]|uniref:histidine kinase n=1 Tax=Cohnella suwonensis TaxID=696072 RepID=A0ABW0LQJ2_9BACL
MIHSLLRLLAELASRARLVHKLVLSFFFLMLLCLGMQAGIYYSNASRMLEDKLIYSARQSFEQTSALLSLKISNIIEKSNILIENSTFTEALAHNTDSASLHEQLVLFQSFLPYVAALEDGTTLTRVRVYVHDLTITSNDQRNFFHMDQIHDAKWLKRLTQEGLLVVWITGDDWQGDETPPLTRNESPNIGMLSLGKFIVDPFDYSRIVAAARFDFPKSNISEILKKANATPNSVTWIQNRQGHLAAASDESKLKEMNFPYLQDNEMSAPAHDPIQTVTLQNGKEAFMVRQWLEQTDWQMVTVIPKSDLAADSQIIRNQVAWLAAIVGLIALALAYFISYSMTRRISALAATMKETQNGRPVPFEGHLGRDELGTLGRTYNLMIKRISELMNDQLEAGNRLREAELRTLQAQINPHFLYNTLDMMNWYARRNSGKEIVEILESVSRFYKLVLNRGNDVVSLKDEIAQISAYFAIQNKRFNGSLKLVLKLDEELLQYMVLKLILQPLVENAILHGILCKEEKSGTVTISVSRRADDLLIQVEDDGVGMPEKVLENFRRNIPAVTDSSETTGSGFGLRNVQERIRLHYGGTYGIEIASEAGVGTIVELRIPTVRISDNQPEDMKV